MSHNRINQGVSVLTVAIFLSIFLSACTTQESETQTPEDKHVMEVKPAEKDMNEHTIVTATVTFIELEGGFYGLITSAGDKLLPTNLAEEYHKNGTVLSFRTAPVKEMASIQQWGTMVELVDVTLIEAAPDSSL